LGLSRLRSILLRQRRIAIDTSVFIYHLEANPTYFTAADTVFAWLEEPDHSAVTSTITMAELLIVPYRHRRQQQVTDIYALLSVYPNLEWVAPDLEIADRAARFRADYRMRLPDALQAATAACGGATAFLTNDLAFQRMTEFQTIILDRVIP
jgi:predicted nucleic acid-binding protein